MDNNSYDRRLIAVACVVILQAIVIYGAKRTFFRHNHQKCHTETVAPTSADAKQASGLGAEYYKARREIHSVFEHDYEDSQIVAIANSAVLQEALVDEILYRCIRAIVVQSQLSAGESDASTPLLCEVAKMLRALPSHSMSPRCELRLVPLLHIRLRASCESSRGTPYLDVRRQLSITEPIADIVMSRFHQIYAIDAESDSDAIIRAIENSAYR